MGKPGVMFYFEVRPCLNRLTREEKGDLFEAILDYGQYGVLPELDGPTGVAWDFLQPKLDRDNDRYGRVSLKKAYAAYVKYANTRGEPTLSYEEWEKQQLAAVTSGSVQKTAYASICIGENADVSQTRKSFRYKPSNRLYISAIEKKMILDLVLVLGAFLVFISKSPLCMKFIETKKRQYKATNSVLPQTKAYLTSFKKTTNPNVSPIGKRFGFECFGARGGT